MKNIIRFLFAAAVVVCLWHACKLAIPEKQEYSPAHLKVSEKAAQETVAWIEKLDLDQAKTFFGNLGRDEFGAVSHPIRKGIRQLDKVNLVDRTRGERFRASLGWDLPTCAQSNELLARAKYFECKYAIGGKVCRFSQYQGNVDLTIELEIWDVEKMHLLGKTRIAVSDKEEKSNGKAWFL